MGGFVFEGLADYPMQGGDFDGMALLIEEVEADGFEGEHFCDASCENPPHPHREPVTRRTRLDQLEEDWD